MPYCRYIYVKIKLFIIRAFANISAGLNRHMPKNVVKTRINCHAPHLLPQPLTLSFLHGSALLFSFFDHDQGIIY